MNQEKTPEPCDHRFHHFGDQDKRRCRRCGDLERFPLDQQPVAWMGEVGDGRFYGRAGRAGMDPLFTAAQMEAYATARVREALEWQPIETAPKDGTHVHLFAPELQFVGLYAAVGWCYVAPHCPEAPTQPTHWKPLPPPPQQDNE